MKYNLLFFIFMMIACNSGDGGSYSENTTSSGQGGSMARFAIKGDYLYAVDETNLKLFDISDSRHPAYLPSKNQGIETGAETIFPLDTMLFIGSQTGMYIYNIAHPDFPKLLGYVSHIKSCDPVVSDGKFAFVTLNSQNTFCGRNTNSLLVYDLSNIANPALIHEVSNFVSPRGLGLLDNKLYVCDSEYGLKVFDVSDPRHVAPEWIGDLSHIAELRRVTAYDIIPLVDKQIILMIGADGFYQLDASKDRLELISQILVSKLNY